MSIRFHRLDPQLAYSTNNLIIPKGIVNVDMIRATLTFAQQGAVEDIDEETQMLIGLKGKELRLWDETADHIIVPRDFISHDDIETLGARTQVIRPPFPQVEFADHVDLRDANQQTAWEALLAAGKGTLNLGCGKGKTVLGLKYAAYLQVPTIVVVNNVTLFEQWVARAVEHLHLAPDDIGTIQGQVADWEGKPLVLAVVHTLAGRRAEWSAKFRKHFGLVIFDEGHHMSAPFFVGSADLFWGQRLALTATPTRTDRMENIYQSHLGPVFYSDIQQELIPETLFHQLQWELTPEDELGIRDTNGDMNLSRIRSHVGCLVWRNNYILDTLADDLNAGRNVLVLSHSVDQLKMLAEMWEERTGTKAGLIVGATDQSVRMGILDTFNPVFGTFQLSREGLDKPPLDTLYVCTMFSNSNDLQQGWGRIQRVFEGKLAPLVRVFEDTEINACVKCGRSLRRFLRAFDWPYKLSKVDCV